MRKAINLIVYLVPTLVVTWFTFFQMINVDSSISNFLIQSIGGGVGTYRAVLLIIAVLILLFLISMAQKSSSEGASKLKLKAFNILSLISSLAFLFIGSEFSAPSHTFASFFNFESHYNFGRVFEQSGVEFELDHCRKSGTKITCEIDVYNSEKDMFFKGGQYSYLIDNSNNKARVENFTIGSQSYGSLYSQQIPLPIQTQAKLQVSFETDGFSDSTLVRALYLKLSFDGKRREIVFRNIPL
jgi:multisubunit Na+/H+ antiporter MnhB subunit